MPVPTDAPIRGPEDLAHALADDYQRAWVVRPADYGPTEYGEAVFVVGTNDEENDDALDCWVGKAYVVYPSGAYADATSSFIAWRNGVRQLADAMAPARSRIEPPEPR